MTANIVIDATDAAFYKAPEPFDGVGVSVAHNIDLLAVPDAPMPISVDVVSEVVINRVVVSEHHTFGQDVFLDNAHDGVLLNVLRGVCADAALALDNSDNGRLFLVTTGGATTIPALASTDVGFVNLDSGATLPAQRTVIVAQHRANLSEHAPRRFIGHACFPLNLLCRNAASSRGHQVDRVEPRCEWRWRFVKDGISGWMNVMSTVIARIRRTALDAVMFCDRFAGFAVDAVWIQVISEPFKAGRIVGELAVKLFLGVRRHLWLAVHKQYLLSSQSMAYYLPTVKG